jgi:hypothetical protein
VLFAYFLGLDFCTTFWLFVLLMCIGIGQAIGHTAKAGKKILQNEEVQEAGKGFLVSWLHSLFKK